MRFDRFPTRARTRTWARRAVATVLFACLLQPWGAHAGTLSVSACPAPLPPDTWSTKALGTVEYDEANDVAVDSGICAVFAAGKTSGALGTAAGWSDAYLARYSTGGALLWLEQFGTSTNDQINGVAVDAEHNVYVVGTTDGTLPGSSMFNLGGNDAFLAKYDENGVMLWTRQLGSIDDDYGEDLAIDEDGAVFITGWTTGALLGITSFGSRDYYLARYDADGNLLMLTQRGTSSEDMALAVTVGPGGNAYVVGNTYGVLGSVSNGSSDIFLAKYDPSGIELWVQQRGTIDLDLGRGVAVNSENEVFVVGAVNSSLDGNVHQGALDIVVMRYETDGTWRWTDQRGTSGTDLAEDVAVNAGGGPVTTGWTGGSLDGNVSAGGTDMFVMKHGRGGVWRWTSQLGNTLANYASAVALHGAQSLYVAGHGAGTFGGIPNAGYDDAFTVKYDSSGVLR